MLDKNRKKCVDAPLTKDEFVQLLSLVGQISRPARESMPRLSLDVSELQQSVSKKKDSEDATPVKLLLMANAAAKKAQRILKDEVTLKLLPVPIKKLAVFTFSDVSFWSLPKRGSQAGCISLVAHADMKSSWVPACVAEWRSTRAKGVVKSTLSAAQDRNAFNRVLLAYVSGKMDMRKRQPWEIGLQIVPGMLANRCEVPVFMFS